MFPQSPQLRPFFADNKPTHVWYADKPPLLGGEPQYITLTEFQKIYYNKTRSTFEWTEVPWTPVPSAKPLGIVRAKTGVEQKVIDWMSNPDNDKFVIAFIDDSAGFGVFARRDIEKGECLGVYVGDLINIKNADTTYTIRLSENLSIDGKNRGNITRFFQHLPRSLLVSAATIEAEKHQQHRAPAVSLSRSFLDIPTRLYSYLLPSQPPLEATPSVLESTKQELIKKHGDDFEWHLESLEVGSSNPDNIKLGSTRAAFVSRLATANIDISEVYLQNMYFPLFTAAVAISQGTQIGWDYGSAYWSISTPELFYFTGKLVPKAAYFAPFSHFISNKAAILLALTKKNYEDNKDKRLPVPIRDEKKCISPYELREALVKRGVLDKSLGRWRLTEENKNSDIAKFIRILSQTLTPYGISVWLYNQDYSPTFLKKKKLSSTSFELILRANNTKVAEALWAIIEEVKLKGWSDYCPAVYEIVIHNIFPNEACISNPDLISDAYKSFYFLQLQKVNNLINAASCARLSEACKDNTPDQ